MGCAKGVRRGGSWDGWIGLVLSRQFFRSHVSSFRLLMGGISVANTLTARKLVNAKNTPAD